MKVVQHAVLARVAVVVQLEHGLRVMTLARACQFVASAVLRAIGRLTGGALRLLPRATVAIVHEPSAEPMATKG